MIQQVFYYYYLALIVYLNATALCANTNTEGPLGRPLSIDMYVTKYLHIVRL